jgi:hypothetical protein
MSSRGLACTIFGFSNDHRDFTQAVSIASDSRLGRAPAGKWKDGVNQGC